VLKNQERNLEMRRMSSRSEVEVSFECLEWPAEPRGEWGPIYSPHTFITVGGVRTSDISDLDQICPIGNSKWLNFGWVRYIWSRRVTRYWNPMKPG
jgi:hypothetical protein